MKKEVIIILLLFIYSCSERNNEVSRNDFANKTFNIVSEKHNDTLVVEFKDSTHQTFGILWQGEVPWKLIDYKNSKILTLFDISFSVEKVNDSTLKGSLFKEEHHKVKFIERKPKWSKELLYGDWVKKEHFKLLGLKELPPPPPSPIGFSETDFQYPPIYKLTNDTISLSYNYSKTRSKIHFNNTAEYLRMNLGVNRYLGKEWEWKVKELDSNFMVLSKRIDVNHLSKYVLDTLQRIKP